MNRSQQIRHIFNELRLVVGSEATARDLLKLAAIIVSANIEQSEDEEPPEFTHERALFTMAVDRAFADGGWSVLYFELRNGFPLPDEHEPFRPFEISRLKALVGRYPWQL